MSVTVTIRIEPNKWNSLDGFLRKYPSNARRAMAKALALLQKQIKTNLSGPSHVDFPGNGNPFPGTRTGRMKNSVNTKIESGPDLLRGLVGPNVKYAAIHETGGRHIPKRSYLAPAFDKHKDRVGKIFNKAVQQSLKGK